MIYVPSVPWNKSKSLYCTPKANSNNNLLLGLHFIKSQWFMLSLSDGEMQFIRGQTILSGRTELFVIDLFIKTYYSSWLNNAFLWRTYKVCTLVSLCFSIHHRATNNWSVFLRREGIEKSATVNDFYIF